MRRSLVILGVLILLAVTLIGGPSMLATVTNDEVTPEQQRENQTIVRPTDGQSGFWPYLNAQPRFQKRSAINVVVVGETDDLLRLLVESGETSWQITPDEEEEADPGTHALVDEQNESFAGNTTTETLESETVTENESEERIVDQGITIGGSTIRWSRATGGTRYGYVEDGDGNGRWITETAQVHEGTYYGQRFHARLYESPDENESWVAIQAHEEHFDWFTLRHRVHGSQAAQVRMERDLMQVPQINVTEDIRRVYLNNGRSSNQDGWATVVEIATVLVAGLAVGSIVGREGVGRLSERVRKRIDSHLTTVDRRRLRAINERLEIWHFGLAGVIIGLVLGVRAGGIMLERQSSLSVYEIAGLLYPFIAVGLPVGTYLTATKLERRMDGAITAGGAFAVAVWLDYGWLHVETIPVDVVVQRMLLTVALGLIAAGAARRAARDSRFNAMVLGGAVMWLLIVVGTLFGYL